MTNENPEQFSDDPREHLRIENEILRMKLQAQFGGVSGGMGNFPPEEENRFLKNVLAFEEQFANATLKKVYEVIGSPEFKKADTLNDEETGCELEHIEEVMAQNSIEVTFLQPRDDRFKYRFITEELFEHETEDVKVPGMITCFTYEEFHPDHEFEIRERTGSFLTGWFNKDPDEIEMWVNDQFVYPDSRTLPWEELKQKIEQVFACYRSFEDTEYHIQQVSFEQREEHQGLLATGFSEGTVKYTAVLESGERSPVEGPFKIYFGCEYGWWSIFFFYLPGFNG